MKSTPKQFGRYNNIWMYWPEENAKLFNENFCRGEITVEPKTGKFNDLTPIMNDLQGFDSAFTKTYGSYEMYRSSKKLLHTLCFGMKKDDIVLARYMENSIVGIGVVTGNYFYDHNRPSFNHCRPVKWLVRGSWSFEEFQKGGWRRVTLVKGKNRTVAEKLIANVLGIQQSLESNESTKNISTTPKSQYSTYKGDSPFKAKARLHQKMFMDKLAKTLGQQSICETGNGRAISLKDHYANQGLVFYTDIRKEIMNLLIKGQTVVRKEMLKNALRSEHIPYNLFFPMMKPKNWDRTRCFFNELLKTDTIGEILEVKIEYSPQPNDKYLNDQTAFDVNIKYRHTDGGLGAIGIEVKYTEESYSIRKGSKEYWCTHDGNGNVRLCPHYKKATEQSGYYLKGHETDLVSDNLRQVWRNHILGASMLINGDFKHFTSLTIYPSGNTHFKEVETQYRSFVTYIGNESFSMATYEEFFEILTHHFSDEQGLKWISYLYDRYLFDTNKPSILDGIDYTEVI